MAKLYKVQLACGHRASTTAEPSTSTSLSLDCKECERVQTVVRWTGGVVDDTPVTSDHVEPVKVEETSD